MSGVWCCHDSTGEWRAGDVRCPVLRFTFLLFGRRVRLVVDLDLSDGLFDDDTWGVLWDESVAVSFWRKKSVNDELVRAGWASNSRHCISFARSCPPGPSTGEHRDSDSDCGKMSAGVS